MAISLLDLTGGRLDLVVPAGADAAFILPTPSDLSSYTWTGLIKARSSDVASLGEIEFTVSDAQAVCRIPAALTATLPPRCVYAILLSTGDRGTALLSGVIVTEDVP